MKICIVGPGKRFLGGITYHTYGLANALASKHDVSVVLLRQLLPRRLFPGRDRVGQHISDLTFSPTVRVFDGVDWYSPLSCIRALSFMHRCTPDILIFQWWSVATAHVYVALKSLNKRWLGSKQVVEFHEIMDPLEARIPLLRWYAGVARDHLFRGIDAYIAHSSYELHELSGAYRLPTTSRHVVHLGTFGHYSKPDGLLRNDQRPRSRYFTFLFFGLIRPYKGLDALIKAFEALPDDPHSEFRLLVVGETWENHGLPARLIHGSPKRGLIEFVNRYATDAEVHSYFQKADVVVLPYLRATQSGVAHIAMSYGKPIVASRVGGLGETLADYGGVMFVDPGDVGQLRDALLKSVTLAGTRFSDPFPWERVVREYESVLGQVAGATSLRGLANSQPEVSD